MQHTGSLILGKNHLNGVEGADVRMHKDTEYSGIEKTEFSGQELEGS